GRWTGGSGVDTVDGPGTGLTIVGRGISIGLRSNTAELNIINGASGNSGNSITIGRGLDAPDPDIYGKVKVDGAGSILTAKNVTIASAGYGLLTVSGGGTVFSTTGDIGINQSLGAAAIVEGQGSTWTISDKLGLGDQGTGTLTIKDDGTVTAKNVVMGSSSSSYGTLNIGAAAEDAAARAGYLQTESISVGGGTINFNHTDENYIFSPKLISIINENYSGLVIN